MSTLPFTSYLFCYVEYANIHFQYLTNTIKFVELPFKDHMLVQISKKKKILEKTPNKSVAALAVIIIAYALLKIINSFNFQSGLL